MRLPPIAASLAHATPFQVIAPAVATGASGGALAAEHERFKRSLDEPSFLDLGHLGRVRRLEGVRSVAVLTSRLAGLQPPKTDVAIDGFADAPDEDLASWQSTLLRTLFTAATALAVSERREGDRPAVDMAQVLRLASSASPAGIVFRERLGGWGERDPRPFEPLPGLPGLPKFALGLMRRAEALLKSSCGRAAVAALGRWSVAMASSSPRYLRGAIHALDPADACPGATIRLVGTGFGDGARAAVVFTGVGGSVVVVPQGDVLSWSDTEIVVTVPAAARRGPVGVAVFPESSQAVLAEAADAATGEIGRCFGPAALAQVVQVLDRFSVPVLGAPTLQDDEANLFVGGPPVIRRFDVRPRGALFPGKPLVLDWIVDGADRIEIVARGVTGSAPHELPPIAGPLDPVAGSAAVTVPGTRRWQAEYVLQAYNRCTGAGAPSQLALPLEMALRQGLALGGGGTRGDFQVGALLYLYGRKGFRPEAIAGTSVGSVNAVDLVMGDEPNRNAAERLRDNWLTLVTESQMWGEEPWLVTLKAKTRLALRSLSIEGLLAAPYALRSIGAAAVEIDELASKPSVKGAVALFNIDPIEARMRAQFDAAAAAASGIRLRLVAVSVDTGEVVQVTETGQVIEDSSRAPVVAVGTAPTPAPDMIDGAVASAAMPGIFRSRRVGDHNAVDGGVRDVVPVRSAVRDLGCNRVYALRCSAPPVIEPLDMDRAFTSVMARSVLQLTYDEVSDDDVDPYNGWGTGVEVVTIQPSFDLHDPMVVEPMLIRIAMDYGWMRAGDVLDVPPAIRQGAMAMCDEIIRLRWQNWRLAHDANGIDWVDPHRSFTHFLLRGMTPRAPRQTVRTPDPAAIMLIRDNCRAIRALLVQRRNIGAPVPDPLVVNAWFQGWEGVGIAPLLLMPDPWGAMSTRLGPVQAEPIPPSL